MSSAGHCESDLWKVRKDSTRDLSVCNSVTRLKEIRSFQEANGSPPLVQEEKSLS